jgi:anti-anti-sigma factor
MTTATGLKLSRHTGIGGRTVVSLRGELDIATADEAYTFLHDTIRQPGTTIAIDATGLRFCGAAGLRVFERVAAYARLEGRPFSVTAMRPSLLRMIQITGLSRSYPELVPVRTERQPTYRLPVPPERTNALCAAERMARWDIAVSGVISLAARFQVATTWPRTRTVQLGMPLRLGKMLALRSSGRVGVRSR